MSDYEQITYERCGPVAIVTIDQPERMNAIGGRRRPVSWSTRGRASATAAPRRGS